MSMDTVVHIRHAEERGDIIRVLKQDYSSAMTGIKTLFGTMDALGRAISVEGMRFHLMYLESQGYIKVWRFRDLPGYRSDRTVLGSPDEIRFARLEPKGLMLHDGQTAEDRMVRF